MGGACNAGIAAHHLIQAAFSELAPGVRAEILTKNVSVDDYDAGCSTTKTEPDVAKKFGFSDLGQRKNYPVKGSSQAVTALWIGEIKPDNEKGREAGKKQMKFYMTALQKEFANTVVLPMMVPFPLPGLPYPDFSVANGCPPQTLKVNLPVEGVYTYYCEPSRDELTKNYADRCRCTPRQQTVAVSSKDVERIYRLIGAIAALAAAGAVGAKGGRLIPAGARRFLGPLTKILGYATAAAVVILLLTGEAEASLGPGEHPLETFYKASQRRGLPVPESIRKLIDNDPELKSMVERASKERNPSVAQLEAGQKILEILDKHRDEFSAQEIKILLSFTESMSAVWPQSELTTERLREILKQKEAVAQGSSAPKPDTKAKTTPTTGETTPRVAGQPPAEPGPRTTPTGETKPTSAAPSGLDPALWAQLQQASPATRELFHLLTAPGATATGAPVTNETLRKFLETVPLNLTDAEVDTLKKELTDFRSTPSTAVPDALAKRVMKLRAKAMPPKAGSTKAGHGKPASQKSGTGHGASGKKAGTSHGAGLAGKSGGQKKAGHRPDGATPAKPMPDLATRLRARMMYFKDWSQVEPGKFQVAYASKANPRPGTLYGKTPDGTLYGAEVAVDVTETAQKHEGKVVASSDVVILDAKQPNFPGKLLIGRTFVVLTPNPGTPSRP